MLQTRLAKHYNFICNKVIEFDAKDASHWQQTSAAHSIRFNSIQIQLNSLYELRKSTSWFNIEIYSINI